MRRASREITSFDGMVDVIRRCDVCRIAFNGDEVPYILPQNFGYEVIRPDRSEIDERGSNDSGKVFLYFHGALEGGKYRYLKEGAKVAFEMDCDHVPLVNHERNYATITYSSVMGVGRISFVPDDDKVRCLRLLLDHYGISDFEIPDKSLAITRVIRMEILEMTGKSNASKLSDDRFERI